MYNWLLIKGVLGVLAVIVAMKGVNLKEFIAFFHPLEEYELPKFLFCCFIDVFVGIHNFSCIQQVVRTVYTNS